MQVSVSERLMVQKTAITLVTCLYAGSVDSQAAGWQKKWVAGHFDHGVQLLQSEP